MKNKVLLKMKDEQDYIQDIAEMRSMMERSSRFLSLSGLSGIMAGLYALAGAFIAYEFLHFRTDETAYTAGESTSVQWQHLIYLALLIFILAVGTAMFLSYKNANKRHERLWNATARRLVINMAVPLVAGGLLILIMISKGFIGLVAPFTLLFYGLALYNASKYTYEEMRSLGIIEIVLGLLSAYFVTYGLLFWAVGFGVVHIIYGIYMHYRYEK
ncbi:MAG TPA: hypothetical protein VF610_03090 [Segetibacter sp.]